MKVVVPTFEVKCLLAANVADYKAGTIVSLAYGVALQGLVMGSVKSILAGAAAHEKALEFIAKYGADSWFPKPLQTIGIVTAAINKADKEAQDPGVVLH